MLGKTARKKFKVAGAEKLTHIYFSAAPKSYCFISSITGLICQNCEIILINGF